MYITIEDFPRVVQDCFIVRRTTVKAVSRVNQLHPSFPSQDHAELPAIPRFPRGVFISKTIAAVADVDTTPQERASERLKAFLQKFGTLRIVDSGESTPDALFGKLNAVVVAMIQEEVNVRSYALSMRQYLSG